MNAIIILAMLAAPAAALKDSIDQKLTITVDELGNAEMVLEMTLSAQRWLAWKSQYGDHPDLFKRDIVHQFPGEEVVGFELSTDNMKRTALANIKLIGAATYKGEGRFEASFPSEWKKVTDTGREWHFSSSERSGQSDVLNQTIKIVLPGKAEGARVTAGNQGEQLLCYTLPVSGGGGGGLFLVLFCLGAAGAVGLTAARFTLFK